MLFLWFFHACRRGSPRFMMVADHINYLTFEDPAAVHVVRRALKLAQAGDLYGAAETAGVELGHAQVVGEGLRRGMRYSIGAEVDNDPRSRPDAQNIVDAMKPDGLIRSVHFLPITHPQHGENWMWAFDNPEFKDLFDVVGIERTWEIYMETLLEAIEKQPGHIVGHFYVPAKFGHWPDDTVLEGYEDRLIDACAERGMAVEINSRYLYKYYAGDEEQLAKFRAVHLRLMRKAKAKGVMVAVGSDAHSPRDQGSAFDAVLALLDEADINEIAFPLNDRLARVALRATEEILRQHSAALAGPPPGSARTAIAAEPSDDDDDDGDETDRVEPTAEQRIEARNAGAEIILPPAEEQPDEADAAEAVAPVTPKPKAAPKPRKSRAKPKPDIEPAATAEPAEVATADVSEPVAEPEPEPALATAEVAAEPTPLDVPVAETEPPAEAVAPVETAASESPEAGEPEAEPEPVAADEPAVAAELVEVTEPLAVDEPHAVEAVPAEAGVPEDDGAPPLDPPTVVPAAKPRPPRRAATAKPAVAPAAKPAVAATAKPAPVSDAPKKSATTTKKATPATKPPPKKAGPKKAALAPKRAPAAKKAVAKKPAAKKPSAPAKKAVAKKPVAKKAAPTRAKAPKPSVKSPPKKAPAKKSVAKKSAAKKAMPAGKRSTVKRAPAKKAAPAKKSVKKKTTRR
jgi:HisJ family histidinol phosphate phosphatase